MTVTIGSNILNVKWDSFRESREFFGFEWTRWNKTAGKIEPNHKAFGWIGIWEFTAFEDAQAVPWSSSAALALRGYVDNGVTLPITITAGTKHSAPVGQYVNVESVSDTWYGAGLKTRYFNVKVRAA